MEGDTPKKSEYGKVMFVERPYCEACKEELDYYPTSKRSMSLCPTCKKIMLDMIYDKRKKG